MPLGDIYQTGTVSTTNADATVEGSGVLWSDVMEGDEFRIGSTALPILSVTDNDTLELAAPWPGSTASGQAYMIEKRSVLRLDAAASMAEFRHLVSDLVDAGQFLFTDIDPPDPDLGEDGQYAIDPTGPWTFWLKTSGAWVEQGSLRANGIWQGGYVNDRYYVGFGSAPAGVALSADVLYYQPFSVGEEHTFDRIAFQVTATGTATLARLAIYRFVNGVPTELVLDAGSVGVGSTGLKTITISQLLEPGTYVLGLVLNGTCTLVAYPSDTLMNAFFTGLGSSFASPFDSRITATTFSYATAFPDPAGAVTYATGDTPVIGLRA